MNVDEVRDWFDNEKKKKCTNGEKKLVAKLMSNQHHFLHIRCYLLNDFYRNSIGKDENRDEKKRNIDAAKEAAIKSEMLCENDYLEQSLQSALYIECQYCLHFLVRWLVGSFVRYVHSSQMLCSTNIPNGMQSFHFCVWVCMLPNGTSNIFIYWNGQWPLFGCDS